MRYVYALLALLPIAVVLRIAGAPDTAVFLTAAAAMAPLSALIGRGTDEVALHSGPRIGGLLNVTMGNAAELIITIVALRQGLTDLVKASIAGSILGNVLLVLGMSLLVGGLRHGRQRFDAHVAGISATMMTLAVVALAVPALFTTGEHAAKGAAKEELSIGIALVLLAVYACYVTYTIFMHRGEGGAPPAEETPTWSMRVAVGALAGATVGAVVASELLVDAVEPVVRSWGITELFLGVMLVPLIGNAAEHWSAVKAAYADKMDLSLGIAIGSSLQIALFVAPLLVLISLVLGHHMRLMFNQYELAALIGAVAVAALISYDGESNWVEGVELLAVYAFFGMGFYVLT